MLWKISKKFQFAADKYIPDSFVFCIILSLIVYVLGIVLTGSGPFDMVTHWYGGLWTMIAFAFQMSFMVVCCGAAARSPQAEKMLGKIAQLPKSSTVAMVVLLVFGFAASLINWAFSLILTPILAMQLSKHVKGLHFPLMIAAGYSTMALGQAWCPSASVYALLASKGHFMEESIGIISQTTSVYNTVNTVLWIILVVVTIVLCASTKPSKDEIVMYESNDEEEAVASTAMEDGVKTLADRMNDSRFLMILIGIAGLSYIIHTFATKGFIPSLNFNFVIFLFLTINAFLYNTPKKFVTAFRESMKPATQVMMQFPFYGGIMGMMAGSGLTGVLADGLVQIATPKTLPFFSYLSASIVNLFVPSQGGQWIVQGPILVKAANALNVDLPLIINSFVYGDQATNLIQPLYVIPALSLVNMKLKDVWGFMAFIWAAWFIVTSLGLLILPGLLM